MKDRVTPSPFTSNAYLWYCMNELKGVQKHQIEVAKGNDRRQEEQHQKLKEIKNRL